MRVIEVVAGVGLVVVVVAILASKLLFENGWLLSDEGVGRSAEVGKTVADGHVDLYKEPARALVGIDRDVHGRSRVVAGDFAVIQVKEQLSELSSKTGISPKTIARGIFAAAYLFNREHRVPVSRQQIVEDLCKAYRTGELRGLPEKEFDEFVAEWVRKKYSKPKERPKG